MAFDQLKTPSVRETFVRDIENKILSGELKIGEKLPPARALCGLMGVSLTIVNAGVSELVSKGFLRSSPGTAPMLPITKSWATRRPS